MNKLIVRLFIFFVEILSGVLFFAVLAASYLAWSHGYQWESLGIIIVGTLSIVLAFGFLSIVIEIHRDLRYLRDKQVQDGSSTNPFNRDIEHTL